MATQQHPAFDPNQPISGAELPRIGGHSQGLLRTRAGQRGDWGRAAARGGGGGSAFVERAGC